MREKIFEKKRAFMEWVGLNRKEEVNPNNTGFSKRLNVQVAFKATKNVRRTFSE